MLRIVGDFMTVAGPYVRCLLFDAHGSHQFIRRCLHGDLGPIGRADLEKLPFWRGMRFEEMPPHGLPRLPVRICKVAGEPVWGLPGPCGLPAASLLP